MPRTKPDGLLVALKQQQLVAHFSASKRTKIVIVFFKLELILIYIFFFGGPDTV